MVSHVFSTALNESVNWGWSMERVVKVMRWESKIMRLTLKPRMKAGEDWVDYRRRTSWEVRTQMEEDDSTDDGREERRIIGSPLLGPISTEMSLL